MTEENRPRVVLVNRCFVIAGNGRILVIKRSPTDTNNPNKWEIPGGKLDVGQDLSGALTREVKEETGLEICRTLPMVYIEDYIIDKGKYANLPYIVIFHIAEHYGGKLVLDPNEHTDYKWVTYGDMLQHDLVQEVREAAVVLKKLLKKYS